MKLVAYSDISNCSDVDFCFDNFPKERIEYVNSINDKKRKIQSYFVTKLLIALLVDNGLLNKLNNASIISGKWVFSSEFDVCFSHSDNIVCVALSDSGECAVDVEKVDQKILRVKNILASDNQPKSIVDLTKLWTERECDIKSLTTKDKISIIIKDACGFDYVLTCAFGIIDNVIIKQFKFSN